MNITKLHVLYIYQDTELCHVLIGQLTDDSYLLWPILLGYVTFYTYNEIVFSSFIYK